MKALTLFPSVVASVALGVLIGLNLNSDHGVSAQDVEGGSAAKGDVLQASAFELVDDDGAVRAALKFSEDGVPNLFLVDQGGEEHAQFADVDEAFKVQGWVEEMESFIAEFEKREEKDVVRVKVQHLLVGVKGPRTPQFPYTEDGAKEAAAKIWQRIQDGEDFDALVKELTDDRYPGKYTMITEGETDHQNTVFLRTELVPAFGNVGYKLDVGEIGIAPYDQETSPFGYHIIKRIE